MAYAILVSVAKYTRTAAKKDRAGVKRHAPTPSRCIHPGCTGLGHVVEIPVCRKHFLALDTAVRDSIWEVWSEGQTMSLDPSIFAAG